MKCNNEHRDDVECNGDESTVKQHRYDKNADESFTNADYMHIYLCQDCVDKGKFDI